MNQPVKLEWLHIMFIVSLALAGCARLSGPNQQSPGTSTQAPVSGEPASGTPASPLDPIPGEEKMSRSEAAIQKSELVLLTDGLADAPLHVMLSLKGTLPTPCYHLRAKVSEPDKDNRIQVEVYSLYNPDEICIQVLQMFDTFIPLGGYPAGTYTVWLNGNKIGDFTQ